MCIFICSDTLLQKVISISMKLFCYSFLALLVSLKLHSQSCKELDRKQFFTSIKFGNKIPSALLNCSGSKAVSYAGSATLRIQFDSLTPACKKKYADLFTFQGLSFSFSQLSTNQEGQLMLAEMYSFFDDDRSDDSIIYSPPSNFIRLSAKLESLYGKPTYLQFPTKTDSLFFKVKVMEQVITWGCNNYDLYVRIRYGSRDKMLNVILLQIRSRNFDVPLEVQSQ